MPSTLQWLEIGRFLFRSPPQNQSCKANLKSKAQPNPHTHRQSPPPLPRFGLAHRLTRKQVGAHSCRSLPSLRADSNRAEGVISQMFVAVYCKEWQLQWYEGMWLFQKSSCRRSGKENERSEIGPLSISVYFCHVYRKDRRFRLKSASYFSRMFW